MAEGQPLRKDVVEAAAARAVADTRPLADNGCTVTLLDPPPPHPLSHPLLRGRTASTGSTRGSASPGSTPRVWPGKTSTMEMSFTRTRPAPREGGPRRR
jgi:hypothetical protein